MHQILLVDDDCDGVAIMGRLLHEYGYNVIGVHTGREAMHWARRHRADVALIDLRLPDISGLDVLRSVREGSPTTACVIVTGYGATRSVVESMRLGAIDVVEKPLMGDDLLRTVARAVPASALPDPALDVEAHSSARWADLVIRSLNAPEDPRTLTEWGRTVGVSVGALRNWCRTAGLSSRRSLLFARVLRATIRQQIQPARPEELLNIVDRRTICKLLRLAGTDGAVLPASPSDFLDRQFLIGDVRALLAVRRALQMNGTAASASPAPSSHIR